MNTFIPKFGVSLQMRSFLIIVYLLAGGYLEAAASGFMFSENKGQWESHVLYRAKLPAGHLFLEANTLTFDHWDPKRLGHHPSPTELTNDPLDCHTFKVTFEGASATPEVFGKEQQPGYENYFIGNNPSKWAGHVHTYGKVRYKALYPGIDMEIYPSGSDIKYDLIVAPRAKPRQISIRYAGLDSLTLQGEDLYLHTSLFSLVELKPYAYQMIDGKKQEVSCRYVLDGERVSFEFPDGYDKNKPLIIDPQLIFATFSGATSDNWGFTATFNNAGAGYSGGVVFGAGYPTSTGAYQTTYGGGSGGLGCDAAIIVYDSTGTDRIYATFLGGSSNEMPHSMVANNKHELYIMGTTSSTDFPTHAGAYDDTFNGGSNVSVNNISFPNGSDIYVVRFSADGASLLGGTFVGGNANDGLNTTANLQYNYGDESRGEIILDDSSNVYVASCTRSSDFPVVNAFQNTFGGGGTDGVVFHLDSTLSNMPWSSFLGGSSNDAAYSVKIDTAGDLYTVGGTESSDFPTTSGALNTSLQGGVDGFITKIAGNGSVLQRSTYMGTGSYDQTFFVDLDDNNQVYVFGQTEGSYMVTPPSIYSNPGSGQFIHKLDTDLSSTIYSTVVGSGSAEPDISPTAFMVNFCEYIYISGWGGTVNNQGNTNGLPITSNAFQSFTDGSDFYLAVFDKDMNDLVYGTYMGGNVSAEHVDGGTSRFDQEGIVYHAVCGGCGGNSDFPTTPGAWSETNNSSNCNNALFKFDLADVISRVSIAPTDSGCAPLAVNFQNLSIGGETYIWHFGDGNVAETFDTTYVYEEAGTYQVMLIAIDSSTCKVRDTSTTLQITVYPLPEPVTSRDTTICPGDSVMIGASGGTSYRWEPGHSLSDSTIANPIAFPSVNTTYHVWVTDSNGCEEEDSLTISLLNAYPAANFTPKPMIIPEGESISFTNESINAFEYKWVFQGGEKSTAENTSKQYDEAGTYEVCLYAYWSENCYDKHCDSIRVRAIQIGVPNAFTPNDDGENDVLYVEGSGIVTMKFQVFNRWGELLFETSDPDIGWDGTYKGKAQEQDVYVWQLTATLLDGERVYEKGNVTLLR